MIKKMLDHLGDNHSGHLYAVFRILAGLLFMQHGLQKTFGLLIDKPPVELISLFGLAGIIELVAGLAIALGLFTRYFAFVAAIEMLVAYYKAHLPNGYIPILNFGELALLYFAVFLVLLSHGSKAWSLEKAIFKKEY